MTIYRSAPPEQHPRLKPALRYSLYAGGAVLAVLCSVGACRVLTNKDENLPACALSYDCDDSAVQPTGTYDPYHDPPPGFDTVAGK